MKKLSDWAEKDTVSEDSVVQDTIWNVISQHVTTTRHCSETTSHDLRDFTRETHTKIQSYF